MYHICVIYVSYMNALNALSTVQCSPANPAQAGEEAVGLADLSGLPSSYCVLVGEQPNI